MALGNFLNQLLAEELSHALRSNKINQIKHIVEDYDLVEHLQAGVWQQATRITIKKHGVW